MTLTENNGIRILTPKSSRYIIHIKGTNVYSEKIYLGKFANIDDYEEVDKTILEGYDCTRVLAEEIDELNNFFSDVQSIIND